MSKICAICNKKPMAGRSIKRRGMARRKGGAGRKITGVTARSFKPNVQRVKTSTPKGNCHIYACTKCIKAGKVKKPV